MKIAIIQCPLFWENPTENRNFIKNEINAIEEPVDLIVLPEMFTSGFTMNPELVAETMTGQTFELLKELAKTKDCAITGSLAITENSNYYNRMVFVFPNGTVEYYDKKHLFSLAGEHNKYTAGQTKKIITFRNVKICLQICYDLRFPVFSRNQENYDLLVYSANWPKTRINAWNILLRARAIENMCFTIGVNRTGTDNNNLEYPGQSQIIDFLGNYIIEPNSTNGTFIASLNTDKMKKTRKILPFLNDKDSFELI
jgi:omega-amidase